MYFGYLKSRHNSCGSRRPDFIKMAPCDQSVAGPHDVVLAYKETHDAVEVGAIAFN